MKNNIPSIGRRSVRHRNGVAFPRRGAAVVELAVCLPVLVLVTLATVEACTMLFVQQTLKVTAFEGARVGIVPGAKTVNVAYQCTSILDDHNVQGYSVTMNPGNPESLEPGDWFTVTATASFVDNSLIGGWLYADKQLTRSVSLRAE